MEKNPRAITRRSLRAIQEVKVELKRKDDEATDWATAQKDLFVDIDEEVQLSVREIMAEHPKLVKLDGAGWSGTDPFVIALARVHGAIVICEEKTRSLINPRIPDVCGALGVLCLRMVDLIREQDWTFN